MNLSTLDWSLIALYFAFSFGVALYYYRRAGKNTSEFFASGRSMPWWLAGTSMVATTFAADTPLAVTELIAKNGIAGNWLWWNMAASAMLTVFFFARLWRRSGVLTDVEFVELRYSGPEAAWLRGIKAVYFGLLLNCIIMGWVTLAMETVIKVLFPDLTILGQASFHFAGIEFSAAMMIVLGLMLVVAVFSLLSGLTGVAVTDAFQFVVAMVGSVLLAVYVLDEPKIGGIAGLRAKLPPETFNLLPRIQSGDDLVAAAKGTAVLALTIPAFVAYIGIQWWSSWYPSAEPGGGGYIAQRMLSAKNEKHSVFATLWFTIAHYCLRPWPWILVALASLVLYPNLKNPGEGFVLVMRDVLPSGLLGMLVAAFLAAFMSTISTHLNWGVSYLVNDLWKRFIKTDAEERYYVAVSRVLTFLLAIISVLVASLLDSISGAWQILLTASAGSGVVLILRWYWWRISAWSELAATLTPILILALSPIIPMPFLKEAFPTNMFVVALITTVVWVAVTIFTPPSEQSTLDAFYKKVRPGGPGWAPLAARHPDIRASTDMKLTTLGLQWLTGIALVYSTLFGTGNLLFGNTSRGLLFCGFAILTGLFLWRHLSQGEETS